MFAAAASLCVAGVIPARADYAILANGFRLRIEKQELRQEQQGPVVRLFIPGGHVDVSPSDIQGYEKEDVQPAPAPATALLMPRFFPAREDFFTTEATENTEKNT